MKKRAILCLAMTLIFVITAVSGCNVPSGADADSFVFADAGGNEKSVSAEEILSYTPSRPDAVGDYMKQKLSGNELYIYCAVSYAVDNCFAQIKVPEKYGSEDINTYLKAITFYSCDSPFLEHNYSDDGSFRLTESTYLNKTLYSFTLPRNDSSFAEEKQQAYQKAGEIVGSMPKEYDEEQKAIFLYDYVVNNVNYITDVTAYDYSTVPIYDALLSETHETICDGFADTLMMLFNMADIESFAVEGVNNKNTGHVVVCAKLGNSYFYFDPTNDSPIRKNGFKSGFYFALSDKQLSDYFNAEEDFAGILPECPKSRIGAHADVVALGDDLTTINEAVMIFNRDGAINVYFSDIVSDSTKENFGRRLATAIGTPIITTRINGVVGYANQ